jgi:aspartate-semialdehyde dehydrogenase
MGLRAGVVGVGPVGDAIVRVLKEREFPVDGQLVIMATRGREETLADESHTVRKISEEGFKDLDVVFFAGREGSKGASILWGKVATEAGCIVIDNSGDFRMHPGYPLVVPEVNMEAVTAETKHICNPNCSTIQMVVALAPLHRAFRLRRVVVSTYNSVSGWGGAAMTQLEVETQKVLSGEEPVHAPRIFSRPLAFECLPHIDRFQADGYTREEMKMVEETRKIMNEPNLLVSATAVRVPVFVGHSESINAEFFGDITAEKAKEVLADPERSPGVVLVDGPTDDPDAVAVRRDPLELRYPSTRVLREKGMNDAVLVGRLRNDTTTANAINLWCVADNLRKGAATNAVQIAEGLLEGGFFS